MLPRIETGLAFCHQSQKARRKAGFFHLRPDLSESAGFAVLAQTLQSAIRNGITQTFLLARIWTNSVAILG